MKQYLNRSFYIRGRSSDQEKQQKSLTLDKISKTIQPLPLIQSTNKRPYSRFSKEKYLKTEVSAHTRQLSVLNAPPQMLSIEEYFQSQNFDFQKEINQSAYLPIEHFEDDTLQKYSNEQIVAMLKNKPLNIQVMEQSSMGQWFWYKGQLIKYSKLFIYQRLNKQGRCARIHFILDVEDQALYLQKLRNALTLRRQMDRYLKYNYYIDNMPKNDLARLGEKQINRITQLLKQYNLELIKTQMQEVLELHFRVQNQIIFKVYLKNNELTYKDLLKVYDDDLFKLPKAIPKINYIQQLYEDGKIVQRIHIPFKQLQYNIYQTSLMSIRAVSNCIMKLQQQIVQFMDTDLFQYSPINFDQFKYVQEQSIKNVLTPFKKEWMKKLLQYITKQLKITSNKSAILSSMQINRFFVLIRTQLQDFLFAYIRKNFNKFLLHLENNTPEDVIIYSFDRVQNVYIKSSQSYAFTLKIGSEMAYSTNPKLLQSIVTNTFEKILAELSCIIDPEPALLDNYYKFGNLGFLSAPSTADEWYFSLLIRLDVVQNKVRKSLSDYLNRILPLQSYLHIQECIIDDNPKSIEAIGELIRENQSQIFDLLPYSCQVGGFLIQMDELIQTINFTIQQREHNYLEQLYRFHIMRQHKVYEDLMQLELKIREEPKSIEELVEKKEFLTNFSFDHFASQIELLKLSQSVLETNFYQIRREEIHLHLRLLGCEYSFSKLLKQQINLLQSQKTQLYQQQFQDQTKFLTDLQDLYQMVFCFQKLTLKEQLKEAIDQMHIIKQLLLSYKEQAIVFNLREELFGMNITNYITLNKVQEDFQPYFNLWSVYEIWSENQNLWLNQAAQMVDEKLCQKFVDFHYKQLVASLQCFYDKKQIFNLTLQLKQEIDQFILKVPILFSLKKPIKDRHFKELSELLGVEVNKESTLNNLIMHNSLDHITQIIEIGMRAQEEDKIEQLLRQIQNIWDTLSFKLIEHKNTYLINDIDELQQLIDDHLMQLEIMIQSKFNSPFLDEILQFYDNIKSITNYLEEWTLFQKNWFYFQPLFESGDISKQLPVEYKKFRQVDKQYRRMVHSAKLVYVFCLQDPKILGNTLMEQIHKEMGNYLEKKREKFARFYFLSNDELLEILSQVQEPKQIQKYLPKLFESIIKIEFQSMLITSIENTTDVCQLLNGFNPFNKSVEDWLTILEDAMKETMKYYLLRPDCPSQLLLVQQQIKFTNKLESLLQSQSYSQMKEYSLEIKNELIKLHDPQDTAPTLQLMQQIQIVDKLIETEDNFIWLSQLRYYIDDNQCIVKCLLSTQNYAYEFLNKTQRLIITPLTEKCFIIFMNALSIKKGCAAIGPTGTGKTETIKELSKALGQRCLIFNCSELVDYQLIGRYLNGMSGTACWVCFDEFNRINVEVLSVMATMFTGQQLFATMNPNYSGRTDLPDNLKSKFRYAALIQPDTQIILQSTLFLMGIPEENCLKILKLFSQSEQLLSKQKHYDYSLRALKSMCGGSNLIKRIENIFEPRLNADDQRIFRRIFDEIFQQENEIIEQSLFATMKLVKIRRKCVELLQLTKIRHGIMLIGPAGGGKSQIIETVSRNQEKKVRKIYPMAVKVNQLFGSMGVNGWQEGILGTQLGNQNEWIVFDGPIESQWVESLNTLLDDTKTLSLSNGQFINMTESMIILFESDNLDNATPATISRCGMVYVDGDDDNNIFHHCSHNFSKQFMEKATSVLEYIYTRIALQKQQINYQFLQMLQLYNYDESKLIYCLAWAILPQIENKLERERCDELLKKQLNISLPDLLINYDDQFNLIQCNNIIPPGIPFHEIRIATKQTTSFIQMARKLLLSNRHVKFEGPSGVGKSSNAFHLLNGMAFIKINYTAHLNSQRTQNILENKLEKRRKDVLGPAVGQSCVVILDDFHMAQECELIRQFINTNGWYQKQRFIRIENTVIMAAMLPNKGFKRTMRHFLTLKLIMDDGVFEKIFSCLTQCFQMGHLVPKTLAAFQQIKQQLLPTPKKIHYQFTMRDVWRVLQSLCIHKTNSDQQWTFEMARVFSDRLVSKQEKMICYSIIGAETLQFCDFANGYRADRVYRSIRDYEQLKLLLKDVYDQPLYDEALNNIIAINRILGLPEGNTAIIGRGLQLAKVSAFIAGQQIVQIERWNEDLKQLIKSCSQDKSVTLIVEEKQLNQSELDDISTLINQGDLTILTPSDIEEIGIDRNEIQNRFRNHFHCIIILQSVKTFRLYPTFITCSTIIYLQPFPESALQSIAIQTLQSLDFTHPSLSEYFRYFHISAQIVAQSYMKDFARHLYFVDDHFTYLLKIFAKIYNQIGSSRQNQLSKIKEGLCKLLSANEAITILEDKLHQMNPQIEHATIQTKSMLEHISKQKLLADQQEELLSADEQTSLQGKEEAMALASTAEQSVAEVNLMLEQTLQDVQKLKKEHLVEIKSLGKPPKPVIVILTGVVILNLDQLRQKGGEIVCRIEQNKKEEDYFETAKKHFLNDPKDLLETLRTYDKNNINPYNINKLEKMVMSDPEFTYERAKQCSAAVKYLFSWVKAMYDYNRVFIETRPLREKLIEAQRTLEIRTQHLQQKRDQLAGVQEKVQQLQAQLTKIVQEKEDLTGQYEQCTMQLNRAQQLMKGLSQEQERWSQEIINIEKQFETFQGDCALAAAFIVYCGPLSQNYRKKLTTQWIKQIKLKMMCNDNYIEFLSNPIQIQKWIVNGLPNDVGSIENSIIMEYSDKPTFCIDPQNQANRFLRQIENIIVVHNQKQLEMAIQLKQPILLENVNYIPQIKENIYITTMLSNPEFEEDEFHQFQVINFALSKESCIEQMLNQIVYLENTLLHQQKVSLLKQSSDNANRLKQSEEAILQMLNISNILDLLKDEVLISELKKSKELVYEIVEQEQNSKQTQQTIEEARRQYTSLAEQVSDLFFILQDMQYIDYMYQFSFDWFKELFTRTVTNCVANNDLKKRQLSLITNFRNRFYNTLSSMFTVEAQILLGFLMAKSTIQVDHYDWQQFINNTQPQLDCSFKFDWIDPLNVQRIYRELNGMQMASAKIILDNFESIKPFYTSYQYHKQDIPQIQRLSLLQQIYTVKAIRPDYLREAIEDFTNQTLNLEKNELSIEDYFQEYSETKIFIFILQKGQDPSKQFQKFAREMNFHKKVLSISLGQNQGPRAEKLIKEAASEGLWVYLQNCHLHTQWMNELDRLCQIEQHPDFRLWITSRSTNKFPTRILQNAIKIQLKDQNDFEDKEKQENNKLIQFHKNLIKRTKFGYFGFNSEYEFTLDDFECTQIQATHFKDIQFLIQLHYGGRISDLEDLKILEQLSQFPMDINLSETAKIYAGESYTDQLIVQLQTLDFKQQTHDVVVSQLVDNLISKLPPQFNEYDIRNYDFDDELKDLFFQEMFTMNNLIHIITQDLQLARKLLDGDDSVDMDILDKLYLNQVPTKWNNFGFASIKPLSSYFDEFLRRVKYLQEWLETGIPKAIWLGGLHFPKAFLAYTQYYSKNRIPSWNVMDGIEVEHISSKPNQGYYIYGIYIQGAKWNKKIHELDESNALINTLPVLYLSYIEDEYEVQLGYYQCPLYKTQNRGSDNLITYLSLCTSKIVWLLRGVAAFL